MLKTIRKKACIATIFLCSMGAHAQMVLTLERALEYSIEHSPELQNVLINLERYKLNLVAQRASLK